MTGARIVILILCFVVILTASNSLYVIKESERGVLLRFREVVREDLRPGLHFKIPIIDQVLRFDSRIQAAYVLEGDYFTSEKKQLLVDSYVMWRVSNVQRYFTTTGGRRDRVQDRLLPQVKDALRNEFGKRTVIEVVTTQRDELMEQVLNQVNRAVSRELGIEILDIRVKKIDYPESVSESVYARMTSEREQDAQEHRSEGNEAAEGIRADADRQSRVTLADAYRDAQQIRGEGDAVAADIYAQAYGKDEDFFEFYRSLEAYRESFSGNNSLMVLEPKGEFFDYVKGAKP